MSGNIEIGTISTNDEEAEKMIHMLPCGDDQKGENMELYATQEGGEEKEEEMLDVFSIEGNYPSSSNPTEADDTEDSSSILPAVKFCEFKMKVFLFETRLTPSDVENGRLFIPVEMAIDHFPPLMPGFQIAYWERIRITTPDRDWLMIITYDPEECVFKINNSVKWQEFARHHDLKATDVIRFYKPFPRAENNNFLIEHVSISGEKEITTCSSHPEFKFENFLFERELGLYEVRSSGRPVTLAKKQVRKYFPAVRVPAETHKFERLYFTDAQNKEWCWKIYFSFGNYVLEGLEGFVDEYKVDVGDVVRFFKLDGNNGPLESQRHFLIEHVRRQEVASGGGGSNLFCVWHGANESNGGGRSGGSAIANECIVGDRGGCGGGGRGGKRKKKFGFGTCFIP